MTPEHRCNTELRQLIAYNLSRFDRIAHQADGLRRAAVTLTIVDAPCPSGLPGVPHSSSHLDQATLILTRRAPKLNRHKGQWALPGGRVDEGESTEDAALRELKEEVGLDLDARDILGTLDDFTTRSGFVMTPFVIWGGRHRELKPDPTEVASIHLIPVDEFLREDAPRLHKSADRDQPVLQMPIGERGIFAPTGALLYQFREVALLGRQTRVAHFDQPAFAWK